MPDVSDNLKYQQPKRLSDEKREALSLKCRKDLAAMKQDRQEWLDKYEEYLYSWNDYVTPNRVGAWDNASNFHVPFTMQQMRGIHARLYSILFDMYPWFYIKTDKKATDEKKRYHESLMQWTLESLSNYGEGCQDVIDRWIWKGLELGSSWIRLRWEEQREKYLGVEDDIDEVTGEVVGQKEVEKEEVVYSGPILEVIDKLNFYIPAGQNVRTADPIQCRLFWSPDTLRRLKNNEQFDADAIDELLNRTPVNNPTGEEEKGVAQTRDELEGHKSIDRNLDRPGYRILEITTLFDINGDDINEKIVLWMDEDSGIIIGWNYAYRIQVDGRPPYFKFTFIPRDNEDLGLVELLYPTNQEIDAMHNIRIDAGTLFNIPWGTRKNNRSAKTDAVMIRPGHFTNVEEHDDIQIKSFPNNQSFFVQEESMLKQDGEKLGLSSLAFSQMPDKIGALGTASGAMSLLQEGNKILDIHIKRLQRSWRDLLRGIYHLVRERLPEGTRFQVTGAFGEDRNYVLQDRTALLSDVDFNFVANSAMLNKEAEKQANLICHQTLLNPLHIQLGIVTQDNVLASLKDVLRSMGKTSVADYVNENALMQKPLKTVEEEVVTILQGKMPPIGMNDDHDAKIKGLMFFLESPEMRSYEQIAPQLFMTLSRLLQQAIEAHQEMAEAVKAQAAASNVSGLEIAPTMMNRQAGLGTTQESGPGQPAPIGGGQGSAMISGGRDTSSPGV